jgi:hypothetical protein
VIIDNLNLNANTKTPVSTEPRDSVPRQSDRRTQPVGQPGTCLSPISRLLWPTMADASGPTIRSLVPATAGQTSLFPGFRHIRASGACSRRASAVIEAVVRAGRRWWSQGGDDADRALLLSTTPKRARTGCRTSAFALAHARDALLQRHESNDDATATAVEQSGRPSQPAAAEGPGLPQLCQPGVTYLCRSAILQLMREPRFRHQARLGPTPGRLLPPPVAPLAARPLRGAGSRPGRRGRACAVAQQRSSDPWRRRDSFATLPIMRMNRRRDRVRSRDVDASVIARRRSHVGLRASHGGGSTLCPGVSASVRASSTCPVAR